MTENLNFRVGDHARYCGFVNISRLMRSEVDECIVDLASTDSHADDRLSLDTLGRVEGGDAMVEGSHVGDVCPQAHHFRLAGRPRSTGRDRGYEESLVTPPAGRASVGPVTSIPPVRSGPRPFHDVAADDVSGSIASQLAREADAYVIGTGSFRSDRRSPFRPADTRVARPGAKQHRFEARQPTPCPGANCDNG